MPTKAVNYFKDMRDKRGKDKTLYGMFATSAHNNYDVLHAS